MDEWSLVLLLLNIEGLVLRFLLDLFGFELRPDFVASAFGILGLPLGWVGVRPRPSALLVHAVDLAALSIFQVAWIAPVVVGWAVAGGLVGNVLDDKSRLVVAVTPAASLLVEPLHLLIRAAPAADSESHV